MENDLSEDQTKYLKTSGEKIKLDLDNCDIKENNYYTDITKRGLSKFEIAYSGYREQYVEQSIIFYYHKSGDVIEKYISQIFSINVITLESHILNNDIVIYVDRFDRNKYLFDFSQKISQ